jgi:CheY-like chemotaxis protein
MSTQDTTTLGQQMLKLGLLTESQLQEGFEEVGFRVLEPGPLLKALERKGFITPYQTAKLLKGDTDGYFIGGYRILYKIASGSFGRVYRAEDRQTGRVVAIKILRRRWSEDEHTIDLFNREGKLGLKLSHPNIVEVLAVNRDPFTSQYYIVMEFVEGENLRDFLAGRGGKLTPSEAMRFMEDAVTAIVYANTHGVTHRDIKLTNILIASQGAVKLVDFGLAGIFTRTGLEITNTEKMDRTVDYAGLEKATGVRSGDVRSDIYFLGCVLYEMLVGRSPLAMSKDPRTRMDKKRFENVTPIKPGEVEAPMSLHLLVERMMSLDPKHRYQTPNQLLDAVREVRHDIEGGNATSRDENAPAKPMMRSVFVVERVEKFQDALRKALKERGYRVFVAASPALAYDRFLTHPYDGLVLNASTTGEEGRYTYERIMKDAEIQAVTCAGILILSQDQEKWLEDMPDFANTAIFVQPVKLPQVLKKLDDLLSSEVEARG